MGRRFVSVQEAAEYLDVSVKTMRRLCSEGSLTVYRLGGEHRMIRLDRAEVEALMRPVKRW